MILVLLGGTCAGKTEFALLCEKEGFKKVITNTTRQRRVDDTDMSYHFLTKDEFFDKVKSGEMIEYAEYNGNYYGTSTDSLSENCVIVMEPNGFRVMKARFPNDVYAILLDIPEDVREARGISRGDKVDILKERIVQDRKLFDEHLRSEVDLILPPVSFAEISDIIQKIKCKII